MSFFWSYARLCTVLFSFLAAYAVEIEFEHSLDGHTFAAGGSLSFDFDGKEDATQTALLQRTYTSVEGFEALFEIDGIYKMKLPSDLTNPANSPTVMASIPVRCWAKQGFKTPIVLQMVSSSQIAGLSFSMFCDQAPGSDPQAAALLWARIRGSAIPENQYVRLQYPVEAAAIDMLRLGMFGGDSASSQPLPSVQLPVDASEQAAEAGKEDGGSGAGKKKAPAKDDRTWIQKNWMFIVPVAMAVMNLLGNSLAGTADQARQREAGRQGAAGGRGGGSTVAVPRR